MFKIRSAGFTLIELLIVVAIIAILAAIAVPNFLEAQVRSKVSRTRADMRSVATGLEAYAVDNNKYPPNLGGGNAGQPENQTNGYGTLRVNAWRTVPHQLTTPIAYLTSSLTDVFKVGAVETRTGADQGKPFASGNVFDMGFTYHNIALFVSAVGAPSWTAADIDDYGMWRIFSLGPDRIFISVGTPDPTRGWVYDPTNGTVSSGLILRTQKDTKGEHFTR